VPGTAIGQAVSAIQQVEKELGEPLSLETSFQGNGAQQTVENLKQLLEEYAVS
jgi:hypothetical protein